ncbi:hypothetical protein KBI52_09995 [Microvirga sp. HBU67558]|uniref:hypothetical protein n=1 Tax=Microvirga TaxID=186650 RepID=UPI001B36E173|nr:MULTISPECIES: hypothetical protein [unclassified Microvirga]MBQ0820533.1 hypothetical protein [Microvirga sp. HBU67558]
MFAKPPFLQLSSHRYLTRFVVSPPMGILYKRKYKQTTAPARSLCYHEQILIEQYSPSVMTDTQRTEAQNFAGYNPIYPLWIHKSAVWVLLVADVIFTSRLNRIIDNPNSQPALLGIFLLSFLIYTGVILINGRALIALGAFAAAVLIVFQVMLFSNVTGMPSPITTALQFFPVLSFTVFFSLANSELRQYTCRTYYYISQLYVFIYLLASICYIFNILPTNILRSLVLTDVERGERLFFYPAAMALCWFFSLSSVRRNISATSITLLAINGIANVLTLSRVYLLCLLAISLVYIATSERRIIRFLSLSALFLTSAVLVYGIIDTRWNPFELFSGDSSGGARALEYRTAQHFLRLYPIAGIGIEPSSYEVGFLTGNYYFAAGDLGAVGVWWNFGLCGLLLFLVASIISCQPIRNLDTKFQWPFFLTGCLIAAYGSIAPVIFAAGGSTFFALIFGMWLSGKELERQRSRPPHN